MIRLLPLLLCGCGSPQFTALPPRDTGPVAASRLAQFHRAMIERDMTEARKVTRQEVTHQLRESHTNDLEWWVVK